MKKIFALLAVLALGAPMFVSAAVFETGQNYILAKDKTLSENVYAAGGSVTILGTIQQDLMAAGGTIIIDGTVVKDLDVAGGNININGDTGEDIRVAGGNVTISGNVGGELLALGGQITLAPGSKIKGKSYINCGNAVVDGTFDKDLEVRGGTVLIAGKISGNLKIIASKSVTIASSAVILGNFDYSAPTKGQIQDGAKIQGLTTYKVYQPNQLKYNGGVGKIFGGITWLVNFLTILVAAVVVSLLFRKQMQTIARLALPNFGRELLRGFIILVVMPIAIIISFITVIGALLGVASALLYAALAVLSSIMAAVLVGSLVSKWLLKQTNFEGDWKAAAIGAVVVSIVGFIPVAGWLFSFVFFLVAFGTLFNLLYKNVKAAGE